MSIFEFVRTQLGEEEVILVAVPVHGAYDTTYRVSRMTVGELRANMLRLDARLGEAPVSIRVVR